MELEMWNRLEFLRALNVFSQINHSRGVRWHKGGLEEWTALEWAGAMCGEAGECANACKKLRRMQTDSPVSMNNYADVSIALDAIALEMAGTFVYMDLLATRLGINLGEAIIKEFNRISEREKMPERI